MFWLVIGVLIMYAISQWLVWCDPTFGKNEEEMTDKKRMKVFCEDCKWFTNAWGNFDCYEDSNNVYIENQSFSGVKGIKKHGWDINKNNDCEKYKEDDSSNNVRDLVKLHKECGIEFKVGGTIAK